MARVSDCTDELPSLAHRLIEGDQAAILGQAKKISQLEGLADDAKNELRANMPVRLFLPLDRRDILRLAREIDSIADATEDVAVMLTLRPMTVPDTMKDGFEELVHQGNACVAMASELVDKLEPLVGSAFTGKTVDEVQRMIEALSRQEHEADKVQDQLAKALFELEESLSPVAIFMWVRIIEAVGDVANHAENVGDLFRLFIAK